MATILDMPQLSDTMREAIITAVTVPASSLLKLRLFITLHLLLSHHKGRNPTEHSRADE